MDETQYSYHSNGEHCSPFYFAGRKWNPIKTEVVPRVIEEHLHKRNIEELGRFLYKHIESQVQRQKKVPSTDTESEGSTDPRKDEAV